MQCYDNELSLGETHRLVLAPLHLRILFPLHQGLYNVEGGQACLGTTSSFQLCDVSARSADWEAQALIDQRKADGMGVRIPGIQ